MKRAQLEEKIHRRQEGQNKYQRLFENYAFPANEEKLIVQDAARL